MVPVSWWRNKFVAGAAATRRVRSILRRDHGSAKNQQAASPPSARPELLPRPRPGGGSRPMYDIPRTKVSSPAPRGERTPCSPRQHAPLQGTLRTDCGLHCGWKAACPPGPLSSRAGWCSRVGAMPTAEASSLALAATCVQNRQRPRPGPRARCAGVAAPRSRRLTGVLRATRQPGCVLPSAAARL